MTSKYIHLFLMFFFIGCKADKKEIFYINSYHSGYAPSDEVMKQLIKHLPKDSFNLQIAFLDAKRKGTVEAISYKSDSIYNLIEKIKPDLIIASDDNAVKQIIEPYYNPSTIPVVFCGVNWSAKEYNLSPKNITGMLEILPLKAALAFIKRSLPEARRLAILSENTLSEQKNKEILDSLFKNNGFEPVYFLVNNFEEWKYQFVKAQTETDIMYMPTNGAIKNWENDEASLFVKSNIKKPIFTCDDFMMKWCVFGFTKVAGEQGIWAALTAKEILNGTPVSKIPIAANKLSKIYFNNNLAKIISFEPPANHNKNINYVK